jgi:hypothetical protein
MHLKPTAGCHISTLIFEKKTSWRGSLSTSHEKDNKDGKVLANLGLILMVLPGPLTDLSV